MNDCKICKQLIKEKHRKEIIWKILCILFGALSLILGILYFGNGCLEEVSEIQVENTQIQNDGDNGVIVIGDKNNDNITENTKIDYTPIICITVLVGIAMLIYGGVLIAYNFKKNN